MASIFVSYRRSDTAAGYARNLASDLRQAFGNDEVFRDITSIEPGAVFADVITSKLEHAKVLLVAIGKLWLVRNPETGKRRIDDADDWVRIEIKAALAARTHIIPVLVEGGVMPTADELPDDIRALAGRQFFSLSDRDWDDEVQKLVAAIDKVLGGRRLSRGVPPLPQREVIEAPRSARAQGGSLGKWLVGAGVALVVGLFAVFRLVGPQERAPDKPNRVVNDRVDTMNVLPGTDHADHPGTQSAGMAASDPSVTPPKSSTPAKQNVAAKQTIAAEQKQVSAEPKAVSEPTVVGEKRNRGGTKPNVASYAVTIDLSGYWLAGDGVWYAIEQSGTSVTVLQLGTNAVSTGQYRNGNLEITYNYGVSYGTGHFSVSPDGNTMMGVILDSELGQIQYALQRMAAGPAGE
jgi:TIR domain